MYSCGQQIWTSLREHACYLFILVLEFKGKYASQVHYAR